MHKNMSFGKYIVTTVVSMVHLVVFAQLVYETNALCLYVIPRTCLQNIEEGEANETLTYILSKYEEADMKINGEPIDVNGKRITYGEIEEINIGFQLMDNTPFDIIQNCVFVVINIPGECAIVRTVCNTFLPITPRPLLMRKSLRICNEIVEVFEEEEPTTPAVPKEENTEQQPQTEEETNQNQANVTMTK